MAVKMLKTLHANLTVYNPGEVAGFASKFEQQLIREGRAVRYDPPAARPALEPRA